MKIKGFEITTIIFDLGGVILDIDITRAFNQFKELGIGSESYNFGLNQGNPIFKDFEIGVISIDDFRNEIRKISKIDFSNEQFDQIWNSIIVNYPKENIEILESIKSKYRTFLMSNTNEIHYKYFNQLLNKQFKCENMDWLFEKTYYSHTSHMKKPDIQFYELIIKENNLMPQDTLFIDDSAENISAASTLGLQTIHINGNCKLKNYFKF